MNKELYKLDRQIQRRYKNRPLLFINDAMKIAETQAKIQSMLIAGTMYHEKDTKCLIYEEKSKTWKDGIHKANKETKQEFEANKAIKIAEVWVNYVISIVNIYSFALSGKQTKYNFSFKDELIKTFIKQLKGIHDK